MSEQAGGRADKVAWAIMSQPANHGLARCMHCRLRRLQLCWMRTWQSQGGDEEAVEGAGCQVGNVGGAVSGVEVVCKKGGVCMCGWVGVCVGGGGGARGMHWRLGTSRAQEHQAPCAQVLHAIAASQPSQHSGLHMQPAPTTAPPARPQPPTHLMRAPLPCPSTGRCSLWSGTCSPPTPQPHPPAPTTHPPDARATAVSLHR